jgi:hypothetical protein
MSINATKENPNGRRSKDLTSKSKRKSFGAGGAGGEGAKKETEKLGEPPKGKT